IHNGHATPVQLDPRGSFGGGEALAVAAGKLTRRQLLQYKRAQVRILLECCDGVDLRAKSSFYLGSGAVSHLKPDYFWWTTTQHTQIVIAFVLGHYHKIMCSRMIPDFVVIRAIQSD